MGGCDSLSFWAAAMITAPSVHEKREWLDRAIHNERMRSSSFLWRRYVELELEQGRTREAKSLLYRAVSECPWSKELHLLAFSDAMQPSFQAQELNSWIDVMIERNLRLRVEWAGIADDGDDQVDEAQEDGLDEVERAAEERRRLMPY
ncbi:hypothetical protein CALVIDRAFT_535443 [Calocera viscosa TUFC12733]|uniref:Suppressor of forked domain-containing protein n=1 Tax=Calocera viscosa (strain TUFC12733) TaxID=1330018 RepID=A0A167P310_CALVF|nr:hypothetical protein CALVIDRAFT_535443 [Calocera viscosa TUFC12733]